MNFLAGRKYCSSFQCTAICASLSSCLLFFAVRFNFGRPVATAVAPFGKSMNFQLKTEDGLIRARLLERMIRSSSGENDATAQARASNAPARSIVAIAE